MRAIFGWFQLRFGGACSTKEAPTRPQRHDWVHKSTLATSGSTLGRCPSRNLVGARLVDSATDVTKD